MPPNLHPRSAHTTTLFTTTLAVSFLVVSIPHLLPCPVPQRQHLDASTIEVVDENGRRVYKRVYKRPLAPSGEDGKTVVEPTGAGFEVGSHKDRECPVPKPSGFVGRWLGFRDEGAQGGAHRRPVVKIERGSDTVDKKQGEGT